LGGFRNPSKVDISAFNLYLYKRTNNQDIMSKKLIRFDWAMKKLLRHKANFGILEGFLSELLRFDVTIESILESEGNKQDEYDKYNRVDILVKSSNDELMLVEVQNEAEIDYFQRMLYGVSKLVTEYIKEGEPYGTIKKIYSINIVYFGLGQGEDYVYEYKGEFVGLHEHDILLPTMLQIQNYKIEKVSDVYPKYYLLKINNFNKVAENTLDEWIYFLKNSEVKDDFKAKGLDKAKEKLRYESLSDEEKKMYDRSVENRRIEMSVEYTRELEAKHQKALEIAQTMLADNEPYEKIARYTGLTIEQVEQLFKAN
jgi:predicted transposase/invertase (TIGR01784 family)